MNEPKGTVFDVQSYSVHDGPGCRTTVFLKGCFLKCEWCANPESWKTQPEILFLESKCIGEQGCKACLKACTQNALRQDLENKIIINRTICKDCTSFECTKVCYKEALRVCGKEYSTDALMTILNRDRMYWSGKGGVTFSGGEPLYQKDFLYEVLKRCKESHIHTAIETTAYLDTPIFLNIMRLVDFAFIDIKHMDSAKHYEKTGVYNELILNNIIALSKSDWKGRLVLRMPLIKDFNDSIENIKATRDFMKQYNLFEINLLPFHRLGESKWHQLGKKYTYKDDKATEDDLMEQFQDLFLDADIACYVAHNTLF